jgi:hypothetical protein
MTLRQRFCRHEDLKLYTEHSVKLRCTKCSRETAGWLLGTGCVDAAAEGEPSLLVTLAIAMVVCARTKITSFASAVTGRLRTRIGSAAGAISE